MVKGLRVPKTDAETVRSKMLADNVLHIGFRIRADGDHVIIPVTDPDIADGDYDLEMIEHKETDYRNLLDMDDDLRELLPSSFDMIGDIVVIKIPDPILKYRNDIGDAIIFAVSNVRAVFMDSGVKGELRIRELERVAGTGMSETIHKEFGVRMMTDPSKVYFNPRLATERMRIASMVRDGETIVDMFAGVAPFPLVISKNARPEVIYAMDLNADATEYMKRNIEMNKIFNIVPIHGDARKLLKTLPKADRIIMNLPQSAIDFLGDALASLKIDGTIHLHRISERPPKDDIAGIAKNLGYDVSVTDITELKTYSPTMSVYVYDIMNNGPL